MALLETSGLTVTFGGVHANEGIDLRVERGSFVGLIGPNGAGKTTFIDAITGFVTASSGSATFDGNDLLAMQPHQRAHAGLTRTFQSLELFDDLSVEDNLLVAAERPRWHSMLRDLVRPRRDDAAHDTVSWALDLLDLGDLRFANPSDLSHGQRKLVGVARALATSPQLVLLDEPAAGLDTAESQALGARLRTLPEHGITVLLVDHDMGLVLDVCQEIFVLDFGKVIASGPPATIRSHPDVIRAYLGEHASDMQAAGADDVRRRRGTAP